MPEEIPIGSWLYYAYIVLSIISGIVFLSSIILIIVYTIKHNIKKKKELNSKFNLGCNTFTATKYVGFGNLKTPLAFMHFGTDPYYLYLKCDNILFRVEWYPSEGYHLCLSNIEPKLEEFLIQRLVETSISYKYNGISCFYIFLCDEFEDLMNALETTFLDLLNIRVHTEYFVVYTRGKLERLVS